MLLVICQLSREVIGYELLSFHKPSRFARSTIPEGKWGTTRSLPLASVISDPAQGTGYPIAIRVLTYRGRLRTVNKTLISSFHLLEKTKTFRWRIVEKNSHVFVTWLQSPCYHVLNVSRGTWRTAVINRKLRPITYEACCHSRNTVSCTSHNEILPSSRSIYRPVAQGP